jgi:uncharacterized protein (DUF2147 family)
MKNILKHGLAAAAVAAASVGAWADEGAKGVWIDHTGRGAVEITDCGGKLCGRVVWIKDAADGEGCGMQIIGNVKPMGDGTYDNGWIYDPDRDEKYDVELVPQGAKLKVVGYAGTKLFSETMVWTRAPANLERCHA